MSQIVDKLMKKDRLHCGKGATPEVINIAEAILELHFAEEYRCYLGELGTVSFYGHEFTGLSDYQGTSVVHVTEESWGCNPKVPKSFYVIEETHLDGGLIWQDWTGKIYMSMPNALPVEIADSLSNYIDQL